MKGKPKENRRPFTKSDFEAVLKSATKPIKKEQGEKESIPHFPSFSA